MNLNQKQELAGLVAETITQFNSQAKAAVRLGVNAAYISLIVNGNLDQVTETQWMKIAQATGWSPNQWKVATTFNTRLVDHVLSDAKRKSLWMGISAPAGIGKTTSARRFCRLNASDHAYFLQCNVWRAKQFLRELCKVLGIVADNIRNRTADDYTDKVVEYLNARAIYKPLIVIDECDKLSGDSMLALINLFNKTEDRLGVILMGTEHLEAKINAGLRHNRQGFDELSSRLGRKFVKLKGITEAEFKGVCELNGVPGAKTQNSIWKDLEPVTVEFIPNHKDPKKRFQEVVTDLRRMKRLVTYKRMAREDAQAAAVQ